METTIVSWGYIGMMEHKMETTIEGLKGTGLWEQTLSFRVGTGVSNQQQMQYEMETRG